MIILDSGLLFWGPPCISLIQVRTVVVTN